MATDALLTPAETALRLGVKEQTLAVWRSTGRYPRLPHVKVGRLVRYRESTVEAFPEERVQTS